MNGHRDDDGDDDYGRTEVDFIGSMVVKTSSILL